ncbi:DNA polymerase delta, subunit 4-domain-containing protein [Mycena albidolilacea]|uniref:DNA polymerase delta, subunit 4-domain-containing protein n=1 Tax=Mycena albidolilacea TaxID=1033008 RepID=A0AAD7F138_9AGAR|nr:DNA polymerase delta, subunit 4-domain-containing protein [Mycena albidolilacea]
MPKITSKSKSVSSPSQLKQATLSFSASKRTASNNSSHKPSQKVSQRQLSSQRRAAVVDSDSDEIELDAVDSDEIEVDDIELSSDEEDEVEVVESDEPAAKETPRPAVVSKPQQPTIVKATRPRDKTNTISPNELPELNEKEKRWGPYHATVRAKRGYLQLIHAEDQDKFHDMLRVFDLSYEYGPCIGVPRLERWERAAALGLNPPVEIRDILTTRQGATQSYSESVFYDQV